jgi:peptide-methionine (S)-S-oxide reductase
MFGRPTTLFSPDKTLPGHDQQQWPLPPAHRVLGTPLDATPGDGTTPETYEVAYFGLGCFWGAEEIYWRTPGVYATSVGYQGGTSPHPTYEEVCSGRTNHTEAVRIVFDPAVVSYADLVRTFFEVHDPTQGMRQGNDVGTQYRSAIYPTTAAQRAAAEASREAYGARLRQAGYGAITTEILPAGPFYPAEDYHQQYLAKVPNGYCGLGGTGVSCPVGLAAAE